MPAITDEWQPNCSADVAARRATMLQRARDYFRRHQVLEVDTPSIGSSSVTDPNIESFRAGRGGWLQTSPEYFMKRLLAAGYPDIYSIARVYRDNESGRYHLPEFTMIEWYRRGMNLGQIIDDTCALLVDVMGDAAPAAAPQVIDYRDAFNVFADLDPLQCSLRELADCAGADASLRQALGDRRDAWLDLVMSTVIAPRFPAGGLTVIRHYPASQAALARLCPANLAVADRFELYCGALELANGYVELAAAAELAHRMQNDLDLRKALGRPAVPMDRQLLAAMDAGLPDCAGVALGFERLHMITEKSDNIRDVVSFS